jgi:MFS family permease
VLHYYNWRVVFFFGILPALVTLWIRKDVPESQLWEQQRQLPGAGRHPIQDFVPPILFSSKYWNRTVSLLLLNLFGLFGWWGLFSWMPPYLSLPISQGGRGFGLLGTTGLLVFLNLVGMLPGYLSFGWMAEKLGRKKSFLLYFLGAAFTIPLYSAVTRPVLIMIMGALVAFFGTGFFSGSGLVGSELFPTEIRARALGFTYNGARTLSALAPFVIGRVGQARGLGYAFYLCALSFLLAAIASQLLPETKGTALA